MASRWIIVDAPATLGAGDRPRLQRETAAMNQTAVFGYDLAALAISILLLVLYHV